MVRYTHARSAAKQTGQIRLCERTCPVENSATGISPDHSLTISGDRAWDHAADRASGRAADHGENHASGRAADHAWDHAWGHGADHASDHGAGRDEDHGAGRGDDEGEAAAREWEEEGEAERGPR